MRNLLQHVLAGAVVRVRLAREHELDGQLRIVDETGEALDLAEHEVRALVGGEAPREANGQRVETQGPPAVRYLVGGFTARRGRIPRPAPRKPDELCLERLMRLPQLPIVHAIDVFPTCGFRAAPRPIGSEVPIVEAVHLRREPGGHMDAVGDVTDRHPFFCDAWIERRPHRTRDVPVQ